MDLLNNLRLPSSKVAIVALIIASSEFGSVAFAQEQQRSTADRMADLITGIRADVRAGFTSQSRRSLSSGQEVKCTDMEQRALTVDGTTTAAERYEAALLARQCLEEKKTELIAKYAPELARLGIGTHPSVVADLVDQAMKADVERANLIIMDSAGKKDFMGTAFGVGVGVSFGKERITEADLAADNTLRATKRVKQLPRAILEAHYYGLCQKRLKACNDATFGVGPFFGLAATNDAIESFAVGVMFGWKDTTPGQSGGFSVGIGAVLDKEVKQLASGFKEGAPLPSGESAPKFETRSKWLPLMFFTRTF